MPFINRRREREREQANAYYDIIYIDPPYNTENLEQNHELIANDKEKISNNKFIYRDKFSRNGWLNMMNERLQLAKYLLKEDGVIFVSIDDNEQAYLKILMDEIFGEENFVTSFPWISNLKGRQANTEFAKTHEYILFYKKSYKAKISSIDEKFANSKMPLVYAERTKEILNDSYGKFIILNELYNSNSKFNSETRPKLFFPIYIKKEADTFLISTNKNDVNSIEIWPKKIPNSNKYYVWRWSKEKIEKELHNLFVKENSNGEFVIFTKKRDFDYIPKSLILGKSLNNKTGNDQLNQIVTVNNFDTAKPVNLIIFLLRLVNKKNARILDFFAGSGTTAHGVLELNREDGGNRSYTVVTNNENNIAKDITYERLYRINKGVGTKDESFDWTNNNFPYDTSLSVFKTKYLNINLKNKNSIQELLEDIQQMLKNFGVNNKIESIEKLLPKLRSLKPIEN